MAVDSLRWSPSTRENIHAHELPTSLNEACISTARDRRASFYFGLIAIKRRFNPDLVLLGNASLDYFHGDSESSETFLLKQGL